jgi:hypothetical protein
MAGLEYNVYEMLMRCGRNRERYELIRPDNYPENSNNNLEQNLLLTQQ